MTRCGCTGISRLYLLNAALQSRVQFLLKQFLVLFLELENRVVNLVFGVQTRAGPGRLGRHRELPFIVFLVLLNKFCKLDSKYFSLISLEKEFPSAFGFKHARLL